MSIDLRAPLLSPNHLGFASEQADRLQALIDYRQYVLLHVWKVVSFCKHFVAIKRLFNQAIHNFSALARYKPGNETDFTAGSVFYSVFIFLLVFLGSLACGCIISMLSAMLFKFSYKQQQNMMM